MDYPTTHIWTSPVWTTPVWITHGWTLQIFHTVVECQLCTFSWQRLTASGAATFRLSQSELGCTHASQLEPSSEDDMEDAVSHTLPSFMMKAGKYSPIVIHTIFKMLKLSIGITIES